MPVTDFIEATEALITETTSVLTAGLADTTIETYSGTSNTALLDWLPDLKPPAVVVAVRGSTYQNLPRRNVNLSLLCVVEQPQHEEGAVSARALADACIALLDEHILNEAVWKVQSDTAVDISPTCACQLIEFVIEDH